MFNLKELQETKKDLEQALAFRNYERRFSETSHILGCDCDGTCAGGCRGTCQNVESLMQPWR